MSSTTVEQSLVYDDLRAASGPKLKTGFEREVLLKRSHTHVLSVAAPAPRGRVESWH